MTPDKLLSVAVYVLPVLMTTCVVQYIRLRVQNALAGNPDPQLGRKAILHFFLNISILTGLVGATLSTTDLMDRLMQPLANARNAAAPAVATPGPVPEGGPNVIPAAAEAPEGARPALLPAGVPNPAPAVPPPPPPPPPPWFNATQRSATALIASGLSHGLIVALLLRLATNDRTAPAVGRANAGFRLVLAGLIVFVGNTASLLLALAEGSTDWSQLATCIGVAVVWGPAAVVHLWLLLHGRKGEKQEEGE